MSQSSAKRQKFGGVVGEKKINEMDMDKVGCNTNHSLLFLQDRVTS